ALTPNARVRDVLVGAVMKFNIAAKLGLLAAAVALLMTALVGGWSLRSARKVLTDREVANLTDEAELSAYELINEVRYLRKDIRDVSTPASPSDTGTRSGQGFDLVKAPRDGQAVRTADTAKARETLLARFTELLKLRDYYLEICCLAVDGAGPNPTLLALGRPAAGETFAPRQGTLLRADRRPLQTPLGEPLDSRRPMFPVRGFRASSARRGDRATPLLLTVAYPISQRTRGPLVGVLLLTIDFEEYIRAHSRHLPRHLLYLTDEDGRILIHPDPDRQQQVRLASAEIEGNPPRADTDDALQYCAARFEKMSAAQQSAFREQHGEQRPEVALPALRFSIATQSFKNGAEQEWLRENHQMLNDTLLEQARKYPGLRFDRLHAASSAIQVSCREPDQLRAVQDVLGQIERSGGLASPPGWSSTVECRTFAVQSLIVQPDLDARAGQAAQDRTRPPRYYGLALA